MLKKLSKDERIGSNKPGDYRKNSQPQHLTALTLLNQYKDQIKKHHVVIDAGCATGEISAIIAKYAGAVRAFDVNQDAILTAQETYRRNFPQLQFFYADLKNFNLKDLNLRHKVDWFFSANTLHWLTPPDQLLALRSIRNILKESGKLILTFGLRHAIWASVERVVTSDVWSDFFLDYKNPRTFYTEDQYRQILLDANFNIVNLHLKNIPYYFSNEIVLQNFIKSWLPHINCVPPALQTKFLQAITTDYCGHSTRQFLGIPLTFNVLEIEAQQFSVKSIFSFHHEKVTGKESEEYDSVPVREKILSS